MKRCLALLLLFASCSGCTLFEEPPGMEKSANPTPSWLTTSTPPPSSTYFQRPFE